MAASVVRMFGADFALRWPPEVFVDEMAELVRLGGGVSDWEARVGFALEDAFAGPAARDTFQSSSGGPGGIEYLRSLRGSVSEFPVAGERAPYWSERRTSAIVSSDTFDKLTRSFVRLIDDLHGRGWLEQAFPKGCVDGNRGIHPSERLEEILGRQVVWPVTSGRSDWDRDLFYDLVEVFHDLVARPRLRRFHDFSGCGWHWSEFTVEPARRTYRWQVNRLLDRISDDFRLADDGPDVGRLIAVTDDARTDLAHRAVARNDPGTGDQVRHAVELFRARGASREARRSAVVALFAVLEQRRDVLKAELLTKDEGALFQIANQFSIRHQRADQRTDYDDAYLDWLFWWCLATVELTDRLLARSPTP